MHNNRCTKLIIGLSRLWRLRSQDTKQKYLDTRSKSPDIRQKSPDSNEKYRRREPNSNCLSARNVTRWCHFCRMRRIANTWWEKRSCKNTRQPSCRRFRDGRLESRNISIPRGGLPSTWWIRWRATWRNKLVLYTCTHCCSIFFSTGGLLHFCEQSRTKHNAVKHTSMTLLSWQFRAQ